MVLTGLESAASLHDFLKFQNNLALTSKNEEVSRTDTSPPPPRLPRFDEEKSYSRLTATGCCWWCVLMILTEPGVATDVAVNCCPSTVVVVNWITLEESQENFIQLPRLGGWTHDSSKEFSSETEKGFSKWRPIQYHLRFISL